MRAKRNIEKKDVQKISKNIFSFLFCAYLLLATILLHAQEKYVITHDDSLALEDVIVEKYYVADTTDYNLNDTIGGTLPKGSVTYRIYIDMKQGYNLQLVYGNMKHELFIETSTTFYNNKEIIARTGFNVDMKKIHKGAIAFDSWVTMGAAGHGYTGIPLSEDSKEFSFLQNKISLKETDGFTKGVLPNFQIFNFDLSFFNNDSTATRLSTNNGGWAALGGVQGPTPENRVLIAQLTTNGKLTFEINVQIGTPTAGGYVKFVAKNPDGFEIPFNKLSYK